MTSGRGEVGCLIIDRGDYFYLDTTAYFGRNSHGESINESARECRDGFLGTLERCEKPDMLLIRSGTFASINRTITDYV